MTQQAIRWRKSSYSGSGDGNACVEIAHLGPHIAVRDSKQPTRARITLRASAFAAFVESLRARRRADEQGARSADAPSSS